MGIIRESELDWAVIEEGKMEVRRKQLGQAAGSDDLGCSLYEIPPGGASWPYHYHMANAEAIYVLSGTGVVRLDQGEKEIHSGDFVALPAGEDGAHRVRNEADGVLRFLVLSTMQEPDVTVYPDSEKIGVFAGAPPGGRGERTLHRYYRIDDDVDYWNGE